MCAYKKLLLTLPDRWYDWVRANWPTDTKDYSLLTESFTCRINLPKRRFRGAEDEEGEGGMMKNSGSSEQLDADGDTGSEVSSEVSFSYEFAQTEVMMKALGNNGEEKSYVLHIA